MSRTLFPIPFLSPESLEKNALIEISLDNKILAPFQDFFKRG